MKYKKSSQLRAFFILCFLLPLPAGLHAVPSTIPASGSSSGGALSSISAKLDANRDSDKGAELVHAGLDVIHNSQGLTAADELDFAVRVLNFCSTSPGHQGDLKDVIDLLKQRHRSEPEVLARILRVEAGGASNLDRNPEMERKLLEEAVNDANKSMAASALLRLELSSRIAETYLTPATGAEGAANRLKAIEIFKRVIEFPLFEEPYFSRVDEFKEVYTNAALRLVELLPISELHKIGFYPFVFPQIKATFPARAAALPTAPLEIVRFNESMAFWLRAKIREEPADSAIRSHLEAVLNYITKESK